jgi:hypothetical protein
VSEEKMCKILLATNQEVEEKKKFAFLDMARVAENVFRMFF